MRKTKYVIKPYKEGKFSVYLNRWLRSNPILVDDIHPGYGASILAALSLSKKDAQKLCRVLNLLGTKGTIFNWKYLNRIRDKFGIDYTYAEDIYYRES